MRIRLTLFLVALLAAAQAMGLFVFDIFSNRELRPVRAEIVEVETEYSQSGNRQHTKEYTTYRWQVRGKTYEERKRSYRSANPSRVIYYYAVDRPGKLVLERHVNALPAALGMLAAAVLLILPAAPLLRSGGLPMTRAHWLAVCIPLALLPPLYLLLSDYLDSGWRGLGGFLLTALAILVVSFYHLVCAITVPQLAYRRMHRQSAGIPAPPH